MMQQIATPENVIHKEGTMDNANRVCGIVHSLRDMGGFSFISLRTGEGMVQCVCDFDLGAIDLKCECAVQVSGEKVADSRAPQGFEIHVSKITVLTRPKEEVPVTIKKGKCATALETDLHYRPVTLRNEYKANVFKLQQALAHGFRNFFFENGFTEIFSPKIVSSGGEGGANIFKLDYFGKKAFLAQSPQFYKQMMVPVYERVYEIGPVFRAEKHDTPRHLNEYISVDMEIGFIDSFYDITAMETSMLKYCFQFIKEKYPHMLKALKLELPDIETIPHIPFKEAKERVAKKYDRKIKEPYDLEPEEERLISQMIKEEEGSDFVFVTHYPTKKRPFYAMDDPADPKYTLSFDLLFRGMEITTGGQRIHDYDAQWEKMVRKDLDPADFESFLMLHKYGCPPHGGLGLGLERLCMKLLEEKNIRATSMFPRDTGRLTP